MTVKQTERRKDYGELREISTQISAIFDILNSMQQVEAARAEREKAIIEDLLKLKNTVDGNGKPGIKMDVKLLQEQQSRINVIGGAITLAIIADVMSRILSP
jgi:hypothetical protein